jgi:hypothetical protein
MKDWTESHAKSWEATWQEPHMKRGLELLIERAKFAPISQEGGNDAMVRAATEYHRKNGQQDILDFIEALKSPARIKSDLPPPFTREARGEPPLT